MPEWTGLERKEDSLLVCIRVGEQRNGVVLGKEC